jgi:DNA-binding transcriptional LysR family regulator
VAAGQVEIGVVAAEPGLSGLETQAYRRDRLVLVVFAEHPLAEREAVDFAEVLDQPFVCLHAGSAIHTFMMNAAAQLGRSLDVRIQVRSFNAVCRMVAAGVGIGMVPNSSIPRGDFQSATVHGLKTVKINDAWAPRDLQLCVRSRAALSPAAAALFDHLAGKGEAEITVGV